MSNKRNSLLSGLDQFEPKPSAAKARPKVDAEESFRVAQETGFDRNDPNHARLQHSIQELDGPSKPRRTRKKTGRTEQMNLRVKPEDMTRFYDISNQHDWPLGLTLEKALDALEKELKRRKG